MNQTGHYLKEKNKKVIKLLNKESSAKLMTEFAALKPKTYSHLIDDSDKKKIKRHKKCAIKQKLKFVDCKHCLETTQLENNLDSFR